MDKISIIVPVFNGEKYLKKCIDSLLSQTFKNIEIILIDDGSTDSTAAICEEYSSKHSNIIVKHIKNSGSSKAREYGIKYSNGKYLSFVDADDFIEKDMIEFLYHDITKYDTDISMCGHYVYYDEKNVDIVHGDGSFFKYTNIEATREILLDDKINSFLCDKLFKKTLFHNFKFSDLSYHEDFACVFKLLYSAKSVTVHNVPKYYYRRNFDSKSFNLSYNKKYASFLAYEERYTFIKKHYTDFKECLNYNLNGLIECGICVLNLIIRDDCDNEEIKKINHVTSIIKNNSNYVLFSKKLSLKTKLCVVLMHNLYFYKRVICLNKEKLNKYNFVYLSAFPNQYFKKIVEESETGGQWCSQKLNYLLINGLNELVNLNVLVTEDPLRYEKTNFYSNSINIIENEINYNFIPIYKIRIFGKYIANFYTHKILRKNEKYNLKNVLFLDILKPNSYHVFKYCKKRGYQIITLITDLPHFFEKKEETFISRYRNQREKKFIKYIMDNSDKFVLLTKYMMEKIPCSLENSIIMEGTVDCNSEKYALSIKKRKNIIMYTGDMSKLYGIDRLIEAFMTSKLKDEYELHLYGKCDYLNELNKICKNCPSIIYHGIVDNDEVVRKQHECKLLVNPRPLNLEFNKYSFPSKIMEYLCSGTPTLTTKLEGIPSEYDDYLNYIDGDNIFQIQKSLEKILNEDYNVLLEKALKAQEYILANKNYKLQAKRIVQLLK